MNKDISSVPEGRFAPEDWEYILLQMVNDRSGIDFGMYRMPTFRRRYIKRMNLSDARDLRDYVKLLEDEPDQLDLLVTDLLIGVTSFFRDPQAFRSWTKVCSASLSAGGQLRHPVLGGRLFQWHGGLFHSHSYAVGGGEVRRRIHHFATDISDSALASASRGVYTEKQYKTVPEEYRKYFSPVDRGWRISRDIRARMVFSHHDILSDPPFAHIDLVSCRNMMIYLRTVPRRSFWAGLTTAFHLGVSFSWEAERPPEDTRKTWKVWTSGGDCSERPLTQ